MTALRGHPGGSRLVARARRPSTTNPRPQTDPETHDGRLGLQAGVLRLIGRLVELLGDGDQPIEVSRLYERERELGEQLQPVPIAEGQQGDRS